MIAHPQPSQSQSTAPCYVAQNQVHTFASRHYRPERQARTATLPCTRRHPQEEDPIPILLRPTRKLTQLPSHAAVRAVGSIDPNHKACSRLQVHAPCDQCLEPKSVPHWTHSTAHTTAPRCTLHTSRVTTPGPRSADPTPHSQLRLPGITSPHAAPQACVLGSWGCNQPHRPAPRPTTPFHNPQSYDPERQRHSPNHISHTTGCSHKPTDNKTKTRCQRRRPLCRTPGS